MPTKLCCSCSFPSRRESFRGLSENCHCTFLPTFCSGAPLQPASREEPVCFSSSPSAPALEEEEEEERSARFWQSRPGNSPPVPELQLVIGLSLPEYGTEFSPQSPAGCPHHILLWQPLLTTGVEGKALPCQPLSCEQAWGIPFPKCPAVVNQSSRPGLLSPRPFECKTLVWWE